MCLCTNVFAFFLFLRFVYCVRFKMPSQLKSVRQLIQRHAAFMCLCDRYNVLRLSLVCSLPHLRSRFANQKHCWYAVCMQYTACTRSNVLLFTFIVNKLKKNIKPYYIGTISFILILNEFILVTNKMGQNEKVEILYLNIERNRISYPVKNTIFSCFLFCQQIALSKGTLDWLQTLLCVLCKRNVRAFSK